MCELVANCPRCGAMEMTFDVIANCFRYVQSGWKNYYEVFSSCRKCHKPTSFLVSQKDSTANPLGIRDFHFGSHALNTFYEVEGFTSLKDFNKVKPPEHIPKAMAEVFNEGATCLAVECFNAAGTMFRLCVDMATRDLIPNPAPTSLNEYSRRNLKPRIDWLLHNKLLPETLRELSGCIREDGNDGAHAGTLTKAEAQDLLDFTTLLLERLYTEPERLRLAEARRNARRQPAKAGT